MKKTQQYPAQIYTDPEGWGVIARGHGLTPEQQTAALDEGDPGYEPGPGQRIAVTEVCFGYIPRVKWCERYDSPCDMNGDWHGHWFALNPDHADADDRFTILHVVDDGMSA